MPGVDDNRTDYLRADKELIFSEWDRSRLPLPPGRAASPAASRKARGILAGLAVGPHVPIPLSVNQEMVTEFSELGVVLLMYALGLEFRL